ncbi:MAG: heme peroxidase family protein [Pseudomonadota bacterium]
MSDYGKYGMPPKKKGHGAKGYWIVGEGYYMPDQSDPMPEPAYDDKDPGKPMPMRFCRMFNKKAMAPAEPEGLQALGFAMNELADTKHEADIPAGMTYLGQFIDHDISLTPSDGTGLIENPSVNPGRLPNERTASLDLDSLYGKGPGREDFYQGDGKKFVIGPNTDLPSLPTGLKNDLPRKPDSKEARIGDHRNDENLAVAQTHLHFLKFHNKVVENEGPATFDDARKIVRQHYQSIVLHDFTPRLVDPAIYDDVMANGRTWWMPEGAYGKGKLCMPVEFSVAAYRLGHSMVRNQYEWNRIFTTGGRRGISTLAQLFQFSGLSGDLAGAPTLPVNWVVDWTRFHDFTDVENVDNHPVSNKARPIDTLLAMGLGDLPEFQGMDDILRNLAVRNLLRGAQLMLPTGQEIAALIGATPLTPTEVAGGPHGKVVKDNGFDTATPLWYYILKEAEVKHHGQHLGEVGSTIVVETFHGLVEGSEHSILKEANWKPTLKSADPNKFTMADMLAYVGELNPLGDSLTS